ncbi:MAG: hypothetical protein HRS50_02100 [Mycoplasmataceae bacterium]|nr:hypothetical protein [Mycoplasmataceae bacterium]
MKKIKIYLKTLLIFTLTTIICFLGFVALTFNPTHNQYSKLNRLSNKNIFYIKKNQKIVDIELGVSHSGMTIDTNNDGFGDELYTWGNNGNGQLGLGNTIDKNRPTKLGFFSGKKIIDINFGGRFSAVTIDTTGDGYGNKLYTWGVNDLGQLGLGYISNIISSPYEVDFELLDNIKIINISLGVSHAAATLDTTGDGYGNDLYTWGNNEYGELGLGYSEQEKIKNKPTQVLFDDEGNRIISLSSGYGYMGIIIDSTNNSSYGNKLYTWGSNKKNESSIDDSEIIFIPHEQTTVTGKNLIEYSAGSSSGALLVNSNNKKIEGGNELYTWGNNSGHLGHGDKENRDLPTKIESISNKGNIISQININKESTMAIINDELWTWGTDFNGQLGNGELLENNVLFPTLLLDQPLYLDIVSIKNNTPGYYPFSAATLDTTGDGYGNSLYTWGTNGFGQLGNGESTGDNQVGYISSPTKIDVVKLSIIRVILIIVLSIIILIILIILIIYIIKYIKKKNNKNNKNYKNLNYFERQRKIDNWKK